ncbi:MAG: cyclic nucleotide-binding domain-containing protein [Methylacidiphilales bacterium]|nr:cyclic nucleotide-binding domain-containing protein [Candidatus Methylacidiphilales bacterium]
MGLFGKNNEAASERLAVLRKVALFSTLKTQELKWVEHILHERNYIAEEVIFDEGDEGLGMYIVVEGEVKIQRKGASGKSELARLGPGSYFGEMALLEGFPRMASAVAAADTRLLVFFRPEFMSILETHGHTGAKLSLQLARLNCARLRESSTPLFPGSYT